MNYFTTKGSSFLQQEIVSSRNVAQLSIRYIMTLWSSFRSLSSQLAQAAVKIEHFKDVINNNIVLHDKLTKIMEAQASNPTPIPVAPKVTQSSPYHTSSQPQNTSTTFEDPMSPQGGMKRKNPVDVVVVFYEDTGKEAAEYVHMSFPWS